MTRPPRASTRSSTEVQADQADGTGHPYERLTPQAVLDALDGQRPYCVASNGNRKKVDFTLGHTGLAPRFAGCIFTADDVQHPKPAPDLFLLAASAGRRWRGRQMGTLRGWTVGGCIASGLALVGLVIAGAGMAPHWPLRANVFLLGVSNGAFSIAAIGAMMALATQGAPGREGVRMGLWGAAQAVSFGLGGLVGTAASDIAHWLLDSSGVAYASVFACEALLFVAAAVLAARIGSAARQPAPVARDRFIAQMETR